MTIAYDAVSNLGSNATADSSWTHTPAGTPRGALVLIAQPAIDTDQVVGVTYGAVAMARVNSSVIASGEAMRSYAYFLGASIPTGAQTVAVDVNSTGLYRPLCLTVTAAADTEVKDSDVIQTIVANPAITLQTGASIETFIAALLCSGQNDPANHAAGADYTSVLSIDPGAATVRFERRTNIAAGGDIGVDFTQASEEACMVAVAIGEIVAGGSVGRGLTDSILLGKRTLVA